MWRKAGYLIFQSLNFFHLSSRISGFPGEKSTCLLLCYLVPFSSLPFLLSYDNNTIQPNSTQPNPSSHFLRQSSLTTICGANIQNLVMPFTSCVTLNKLLNLCASVSSCMCGDGEIIVPLIVYILNEIKHVKRFE